MFMSSQVVREFPYRPNRIKTAALFALALCGNILAGFFALYPGNDPVKASGFELTPAQFHAVMLVLAVILPLGTIMLAALLIYSFVGKTRIIFMTESIIIPKPNRLGVSSHVLEIPFKEIRSVNIKDFMGGTKLLEIDHASGRAFLGNNMFPTSRDFEAVCTLLSAAIADNQNPSTTS
jgi:hypothetical protein